MAVPPVSALAPQRPQQIEVKLGLDVNDCVFIADDEPFGSTDTRFTFFCSADLVGGFCSYPTRQKLRYVLESARAKASRS